MTQPDMLVLTADGRARLADKAEHLRRVVLPELRQVLADPRRDPTVEADYGRALGELSRLEGVLAAAEDVDRLPEDPALVEIGDLVTLEVQGEIERFLLVHPAEAPVDDLRISVTSPLARAIMGHRVGDVVEVRGLAGTCACQVLGATRPSPRPA